MFRFLLAIATFWLSEQHGIMQPARLWTVHCSKGSLWAGSFNFVVLLDIFYISADNQPFVNLALQA
jgi:hypothetical protein